MESERITQSSAGAAEAGQEVLLRPQHLEDFIGQTDAKGNLKVFIEAAKLRGEPLDHVLFYGPPGLGKTTLAGIIANELGVDIKITSGPAIGRAGDLAAILTNLNDNDVLFIDEIHRLNRSVEEVLYSAMEDYALDIIIGKGPSARSIRLDIARFTLIGATTRAGSLSAPLRDRFGVISKFEIYKKEELADIIRRSARLMGVEIDEDATLLMAQCSRGTPRIANRLLKRIRDFSQVRGNGRIDLAITEEGLKALGVDSLGLERLDREILSTIIDRFGGGPVGIDTIAASIGEERITIEDAYEPYLIQTGLLYRTQKGRMVSRLGYEHMGLRYPYEDDRREISESEGRTGEGEEKDEQIRFM
ncbi:Holliday junction branch migration DNA helicase RuvB [Hornefia butyriciproducens]|uniref:Holliday junction branch migration DNA helicase RuvB n=1 Tax=Hornefia butyriciproducens TaxID=2652293 RepID=UPI002A91E8BC|nr:Holliday junction branch migration DNA helicase RuvB [Hornefia butyriciproducens]MDY5423423.1 Holliday junction branch migration DNA helicase RuvB [Hornefia butyriciproducens]